MEALEVLVKSIFGHQLCSMFEENSSYKWMAAEPWSMHTVIQYRFVQMVRARSIKKRKKIEFLLLKATLCNKYFLP